MRAASRVIAAVVLLAGGVFSASASAAPKDISKVLEECRAVADRQIAETVGADSVRQHFYGAVCRWGGAGKSGEVRVTFNWFEKGSLQIERDALNKLGYSSKEAVVDGRKVIEERRPNDPNSCGVTATALDKGVVGWWVQYQSAAGHDDPCAVAKQLMKLTLNLSV